MTRNSIFKMASATLVATLAMVGATAANAQVAISNSPDTAPSGSGLANMNLSTLLANVGIGSNLVTDQIAERAFGKLDGSTFTPQIDVLFASNVRSAAAGYKPYHRIGWYQRASGQGAPLESAVHDVVWESNAYVNGATAGSSKLTTSVSDFAALSTANPFELRLTSATPDNARGGSIYGNDALNVATFRNIAYFKERDLQGNLVANSYIVAWEDLLGGGDKDYQDMVVRVKYVKAVDAVATSSSSVAVGEASSLPMVLLGGAALLGTVVVTRRKKAPVKIAVSGRRKCSN